MIISNVKAVDVAQFKLISLVCLQILRNPLKTAHRITDLQNGIQTRDFVV